MPSQPVTTRRRWSRRRKLLLSCLLLPLWFVAAELLFRGALWIGGHPYDAAEAQTAILRAVSQLNDAAEVPQPKEEDLSPEVRGFYSSWHPHPFFAFEDNTTPPMMVKHLARLRGERDPNKYQILVVGGSVAMFFNDKGAAVLGRRLSSDPRFEGRNITFQNYARPAFKQPQQLMQVAYLFELGYEPDAVIDIDGFNEAAFSWSNIGKGVSPVYPDFSIWSHAVRSDPNDRRDLDCLLEIRAAQNNAVDIARSALALGFSRSSILGRLTITRLNTQTARALDARRRYVERMAEKESSVPLKGPQEPGGKPAELDLVVRSWIEASRSLEQICAGRSIFFLHVLQPTLFDTSSKALTAKEISTQGSNSDFIEGVQAFYPRFRSAGAELTALGVHFADCSGAFSDASETLYYDHCHFNARGNEILADRIADEFLRLMPAVLPRHPVPEAR